MPRRQASNTAGNAPITRPPPQRVGRNWHIPREHPLTSLLQSTDAGLVFHLEEGQPDMLVVPTHLMLGVLLALGVLPPQLPRLKPGALKGGRAYTAGPEPQQKLSVQKQAGVASCKSSCSSATGQQHAVPGVYR